jgi:hypothetical protein
MEDKMKYLKYLFYLLEHKKNVLIECWKMSMFWHGITHDMSKFRPSEFIPYARFFARKNRAKEYKQSDGPDMDFQRGWNLHQKRNRHHWNYWVSVTRRDKIIPLPMPTKYIKQMICDWKAMSRKFGGCWQDYYRTNHESFILHDETRERISNKYL